MRAVLAALLLAACSQPTPAKDRPPVDLLTGLPLFWGEGRVGDILNGTAQRSRLIVELEKHWTLRPLDVARRKQLSEVDRLWIVQPQALAPGELVDIEKWVKKGGRALIFADPALRWPSTLPGGDPRRAPTASLLEPLFDHWGIRLLPAAGMSPAAETIGGKMVILEDAGRWEATHERCEVETPRIAHCHIGKGEVTLVADVDFANPTWAVATSGRNFEAVNALMEQIWTDDSSEDVEQRRNTPP